MFSGKSGKETMKNGFTTVELLVAIVVASIVTTLGFTFYGQVTKHFSRQSARAQRISEVLIAKKRIDNCCNKILSVQNCSGNAVDVKLVSDNKRISIRKSGTVLIAETDTVVENVDSFSFDILKGRKRDAGNAVLCWEAVIGGEWVCGAVGVKK